MENNWIENTTGKCPVEEGTLIDVQYRDGEIKDCLSALESEFGRDSTNRFWLLESMQNDIIKWRLWASGQTTLDDALGSSTIGVGALQYPKTSFKPSSEAELKAAEAARISNLLSEKLSAIADIAYKLTRKNFSVADIKLVKDLLESMEEYEENK